MDKEKDDMPLISIIIPVYNIHRYLDQCISSVTSQTYERLEILIIDDGSNDGSGEICDSHSKRDNRIRVFHTNHKGMSAARNHGLDSASGEYIFFLDSDDWVDVRAIEVLLKASVVHDADISICPYYKTSRSERKPSYVVDSTVELKGMEIIRSQLRDPYIGHIAWNKLYRKSLFESIRYPEGKVFEDISTTYKLLLAAKKAVCISSPLIYYRVRRNSISRTYTMRNLIDYWDAFFSRFRYLKEYTSESDAELIRGCLWAIGRMWRWYCGCPKDERCEADNVLNEMQIFAQTHYNEVKLSNKYSKREKLYCKCGRSRSIILMRTLYIVNRIYRGIKNFDKYSYP